ncbi:hypothetical protein JD844_007405 [Phrynosoma platyrhinos]|uniref:PA domain-containing protein n=1 Tax=Phrynosoma platyrhinos TaxID=52577 RepID=A0ABQ7T3E8_PHRPL|nr:hypothetical protein JD844_007405 [Phrynosoma platyrhinos]
MALLTSILFLWQVLNAQRAGYKAAIVHNVDSDELISMGSQDIDVLKKIDIPSVFIGESSAKSLKEEFTYEKGGHIVLIPEFSLPLEYYLIPFLIIVGICLILIVIFMITKFVQDRHRARRNRLQKDQLKKLPIHKFKKGKCGFLELIKQSMLASFKCCLGATEGIGAVSEY